MKKAYTALALAFLLALSLCSPAMAAMEYGVIYDETESLGSQELTMQGEQTLPQLSQALGLDLRVDVLAQISYDSITETAAGIYARYNYGYGEEKDGVSLTIFMEACFILDFSNRFRANRPLPKSSPLAAFRNRGSSRSPTPGASSSFCPLAMRVKMPSSSSGL